MQQYVDCAKNKEIHIVPDVSDKCAGWHLCRAWAACTGHMVFVIHIWDMRYDVLGLKKSRFKFFIQLLYDILIFLDSIDLLQRLNFLFFECWDKQIKYDCERTLE